MLHVRSVSLAIIVLLISAAPASAQLLGSAEQFGVLGGTTVTNTGPTVVTGDVGVSPGTAITGFPVPGTATALHAGDAVAGQAQTDLTVAYNTVAGTACGTDLTGQDLGGLTLTPGVYCFSTSAQLTGTLTLDFQGNPNAVFMFKIGSTLTTASGSSVVAINNGGALCPPNVYWQVGSSATLGTNTNAFLGNILAFTSITLNTGARLNGRALARNGAVTLDTNTVTACAAGVACPVITVNPATLPGGTVGTPYNATVSATGGSGAYTFIVSSGTLPAGLVLNPATGAITGTPTTPGTSGFIITATDTAGGCIGNRPYSVMIAGVPVAPVVPVGIPTLDFLGLAILFVLVAATGLFVMSRF